MQKERHLVFSPQNGPPCCGKYLHRSRANNNYRLPNRAASCAFKMQSIRVLLEEKATGNQQYICTSAIVWFAAAIGWRREISRTRASWFDFPMLCTLRVRLCVVFVGVTRWGLGRARARRSPASKCAQTTAFQCGKSEVKMLLASNLLSICTSFRRHNITPHSKAFLSLGKQCQYLRWEMRAMQFATFTFFPFMKLKIEKYFYKNPFVHVQNTSNYFYTLR